MSELAVSTGLVHRLSGTIGLLPNAHWLGVAGARSIAVANRALEGEAVDVLDLLRLEADDAGAIDADRRPAVQRAADCVATLEEGLQELSGGKELDGRFLARVTARLGTGGGRGGRGEAVGSTSRLSQALRELVDPAAPLLVRLALAQWRLGARSRRAGAERQVGPLLVPFGLAHAGVIGQPVLRLSVHFAAHVEEYHALLGGTEPEPWVRWFLGAVRAQASADMRWAIRLRQVQLATTHRLRKRRASGTAVSAAGALMARPLASARSLATELGVSPPTARLALAQLVESGEVIETTMRRRSRRYLAAGMLAEVYGEQAVLGSAGQSAS